MSGMHSVGHRPAAFMVHSDFLRLPEELNMRIMGLDFGSKTVGIGRALCRERVEVLV